MVKKFAEAAQKHIKSQKHAWNGLYLILVGQANFRIEAGITIFVFLAGAYFRLTLLEWYGIIFSVTLVLISEALNSALESACDAITTQRHGAIKYAKDVAAGAVLLSAMAAVVVGFIVFWPYVLNLFAK